MFIETDLANNFYNTFRMLEIEHFHHGGTSILRIQINHTIQTGIHL
jgi:hypothetical protein